MPEPIIDPATIAVELKRPRLWTSFGASVEVEEDLLDVNSRVGIGLVLLETRAIVFCFFDVRR
jgi:hypothetical protein